MTHEELAALTREQLLAMILEPIEEDETPLDSFLLHTAQGREDFLYRLAAIGDGGIFAAIAHIWGSLAEPRAYRCAKMCVAAGVSGGGKAGLAALLTQFLDEFMIPPAQPARDQFATFADWHHAVMHSWDQEHERELALVRRYAAILDGG